MAIRAGLTRTRPDYSPPPVSPFVRACIRAQTWTETSTLAHARTHEDERGNRWVGAESALTHFNEFPFRVPSEEISYVFPA